MALAGIDWERLNVDVDRMSEHVREASELLKALAHEGRLLVDCVEKLGFSDRSRFARPATGFDEKYSGAQLSNDLRPQ